MDRHTIWGLHRHHSGSPKAQTSRRHVLQRRSSLSSQSCVIEHYQSRRELIAYIYRRQTFSPYVIAYSKIVQSKYRTIMPNYSRKNMGECPSRALDLQGESNKRIDLPFNNTVLVTFSIQPACSGNAEPKRNHDPYQYRPPYTWLVDIPGLVHTLPSCCGC